MNAIEWFLSSFYYLIESIFSVGLFRLVLIGFMAAMLTGVLKHITKIFVSSYNDDVDDDSRLGSIFSVIGVMIFILIVTSPIFQDDDTEIEQEEINSTCVKYEWVKCEGYDRLNECELFTEEIIEGPYWNETVRYESEMRKQNCTEWEEV